MVDSDFGSDSNEIASRRKKKAEENKIIDVCIDKDDSITSIQNEESDWLDFFYYCIDMTSANLLFIAET